MRRGELERLQLDYQERFGVGPCGAVAAALRAAGAGTVQGGQFGPRGDYSTSFPHFWIRRPDGRVLDLVNPELGKPGQAHWDAEDLRPDEWPDLTGAAEVEFVWPYLRRAGAVHGDVRGLTPAPATDPAHESTGSARRRGGGTVKLKWHRMTRAEADRRGSDSGRGFTARAGGVTYVVTGRAGLGKDINWHVGAHEGAGERDADWVLGGLHDAPGYERREGYLNDVKQVAQRHADARAAGYSQPVKVVEATWHSTRGGPGETQAQARRRWAAQGRAARAAASGQTAREAGVGFGDYGRVGTAAELYKRLIMEHVPVLSNEAVREEVARRLGEAAAGPRTNAAWYRNWLKRNGHRPPAGR